MEKKKKGKKYKLKGQRENKGSWSAGGKHRHDKRTENGKVPLQKSGIILNFLCSVLGMLKLWERNKRKKQRQLLQGVPVLGANNRIKGRRNCVGLIFVNSCTLTFVGAILFSTSYESGSWNFVFPVILMNNIFLRLDP